MPILGSSTRWKLAGAGVAFAVLAGCGGGGTKAAQQTTTTVDRVAAKAALEGRVLTAKDLMTADPLDPGWKPGSASDGVDIKLPDCVQEAAGNHAVATAASDLVTNNNLKLPAIQEDISSYATGDAQKAFTAAAARLDGCKPTFVFQGKPAVGQITRLPLTVGGAQSIAWRTTVTIAGAAVSITSVHVQQGNLEMALVHVDLGTPTVATLQALGAKALAKLG